MGQLAVTIDATLGPMIDRAAPLAEYAWRFRYPGIPDEPTLDEVDQAIAEAREVTGRLKEWSVVRRLGDVPALVIGGRHDEVVPEVTEAVHHGIEGSEYVLFERSSHMPHLEEPERFRDVLEAALQGADAAALGVSVP